MKLLAALTVLFGVKTAQAFPGPSPEGFEFTARAGVVSIIAMSSYEHMHKKKGYSKDEAFVRAFGLAMLASSAEMLVSGPDSDKVGAALMGSIVPLAFVYQF